MRWQRRKDQPSEVTVWRLPDLHRGIALASERDGHGSSPHRKSFVEARCLERSGYPTSTALEIVRAVLEPLAVVRNYRAGEGHVPVASGQCGGSKHERKALRYHVHVETLHDRFGSKADLTIAGAPLPAKSAHFSQPHEGAIALAQELTTLPHERPQRVPKFQANYFSKRLQAATGMLDSGGLRFRCDRCTLPRRIRSDLRAALQPAFR